MKEIIILVCRKLIENLQLTVSVIDLLIYLLKHDNQIIMSECRVCVRV